MWTGSFWRATAERAAKTSAQAALAMLGAGAVDVLAADWVSVASVSAGAAVVSVLMSLASARSEHGGVGSPSLVD